MAKLNLFARSEELGRQQKGRVKNVKSSECYMAVVNSDLSSSLAFGYPSAPLAHIFSPKTGLEKLSSSQPI